MPTHGGVRLMSGYSACSAPQFSVSVGLNNQVSGNTYDAAGNLLNDGHNYTYDAENRMTSALSSVNYTYDAENWRVKKSDGELHWYNSPCAHKLADVFDLSGNLKAEYYYLGSLLVASRSAGCHPEPPSNGPDVFTNCQKMGILVTLGGWMGGRGSKEL